MYNSGFHTQRSEFLVVGLFLLHQFSILFSLLINPRRTFKEKFHLLTSVAVNLDRAGFRGIEAVDMRKEDEEMECGMTFVEYDMVTPDEGGREKM